MVKRYTVSIDDDGPVCMASDHGRWVKHEDHAEALAEARREGREAAIEDCAQAVLEAVKDYYPHAKGPYLHAAEILRDLAKRPGPEGGSCPMDNDDLNDGLDPMEVEG